MKGHGEKTQQKQELAIASLLQSSSILEAAKGAGISESTLMRWLRDEAFQEEYREAKRQVVQQAISQLQRNAGKAVKVLLEIAEDANSPSSARVSAARSILEMAVKAVELDGLEQRIEKLEKQISEGEI